MSLAFPGGDKERLSPVFKDQKEKTSREGFSELSRDTLEIVNGRANYLKKKIIYYIFASLKNTSKKHKQHKQYKKNKTKKKHSKPNKQL